MKLIGLISPNTSDDTLVDVYKIFPEGTRIEGRTLHVSNYTDDEFQRAEETFQGLVRDLARLPLDFLMVTGELFLSYKGPGADREILIKRSHFAGGDLTPPLFKISQRGCSPPLKTP